MKTITFYSYKGGVGRSLILANVAKRLTEIGKNVCMLDFDLEAPGLDFKFMDYQSEDNDKGVVDFITSYTEDGILPQDILEYTSEIKIAARKHHGWLKLISAGDIDTGSTYWKKLMSIDWRRLFYSPDGKGYELILHLKALIEKQVKPDYLLVDSRTGITETSGITLSILADGVVIVAANNDENFFGSVLIMQAIKENVLGTNPKIHFVLSRVPYTDTPEDREKEFDRIVDLKIDFKEEGIEIDEIHVIHSDRMLEEEEVLKIGEIEKQNEISIENDYLHFFDKVIKPDLASAELAIFEGIVKAKKLLTDANDETDLAKKLKLLDSSISLDPENHDSYTTRAFVNELLNDLKKAEEDYLLALDYSMYKSESYFDILIFYQRNKLFNRIIDLDKTESLSDHLYDVSLAYGPFELFNLSVIGNAYSMLDQFDIAHDIYNAVLKRNPDRIASLYQIGELYLKQGKTEQSERYIDDVLKRSGTHVKALYAKAIILSQKNMTEDMFLYLDRAIDSDEIDKNKAKIKAQIATEPEFRKYYNDEAFKRILYKYNIRLKSEQ